MATNLSFLAIKVPKSLLEDPVVKLIFLFLHSANKFFQQCNGSQRNWYLIHRKSLEKLFSVTLQHFLKIIVSYCYGYDLFQEL